MRPTKGVAAPGAGGRLRGVLAWGVVAFPVLLVLLAALLFRCHAPGAQDLQAKSGPLVNWTNVAPERGALTATGGEMLCFNQPVYRFVLDLEAVRCPREPLSATAERVAKRLARFQSIFPPGAVAFSLGEREIADRIRQEGLRDFVLGDDWDVPPALVARYARFRDQFPEIRLEPTYCRVCAASDALANTLGRVASDGADRGLGRMRPEMRGVSGLELVLDRYLRGRSEGEEGGVPTGGYHRVADVDAESTLAGRSLRLTFDLPVQAVAERFLLGEDAGAFVVIELPGMEVRAMGGASPAPTESAEMVAGAAPDGMLDVARFWRTPPGNAFAMVPFAAALMSGRLSPDATFACIGSQVGNGCSKAHGRITIPEALAQSCTVATYEAAKLAGAENIVHWAHQFGFGETSPCQPTGLPLAGSRIHAEERWTDAELWNLAIGQGETEASVVTLAMVAVALVTGELVLPSYVEEASLPPGDRYGREARVVRRIELRPEVRGVLLAGMLGCTQYGTGRAAACGGIPILAKTGTTPAGSESGPCRNALMIALVPAQHPKYCIVCAIRDGKGGGGNTIGPRLRNLIQELVGLGRLSSAAPAGAG